jgi:hypothetical protein
LSLSSCRKYFIFYLFFFRLIDVQNKKNVLNSKINENENNKFKPIELVMLLLRLLFVVVLVVTPEDDVS